MDFGPGVHASILCTAWHGRETCWFGSDSVLNSWWIWFVCWTNFKNKSLTKRQNCFITCSPKLCTLLKCHHNQPPHESMTIHCSRELIGCAITFGWQADTWVCLAILHTHINYINYEFRHFRGHRRIVVPLAFFNSNHTRKDDLSVYDRWMPIKLLYTSFLPEFHLNSITQCSARYMRNSVDFCTITFLIEYISLSAAPVETCALPTNSLRAKHSICILSSVRCMKMKPQPRHNRIQSRK